MREEKSTRKFRSSNLNSLLLSVVVAALLTAWFALPAYAQEDEEQKGINQGNYNIKQSVEFGGRLTSIGGDAQSYDTFVNLQQGARLLGFTTEMRSLNHHDTFFDRLYFSNFGYGGDPNDVSRLHISKNKWYDFDALFRRDENFWDYSLLSNPLNPSAVPANAPAHFNPQINALSGVLGTSVLGYSPDRMDTRRRMGDYNLVIAPQSKIRLRLGYTHNTSSGPAYSTIHQGTEQALLENYDTLLNTYRIGFDYKALPRTNISYDQTWSFFQNNTTETDNNLLFPVSANQLVDLGVSFNVGASQPCSGTFLANGLVNPACSAYTNYLNQEPTRTHIPTEQVSIQSSYWQDWDLSAKFVYSGGTTRVVGYDTNLAGLESRTDLLNQTGTGPIFGKRVAASADFGATWHITKSLNFIDSFHFENWHDPMTSNISTCSFFGANLLAAPGVYPAPGALPVTCPAPVGGVAVVLPGTLTHSTSSYPDASLILNSNFLKQEEFTNLSELEYQFSSRLGVRLGFRYRHRNIDDNYYATSDEIYYPNNANRGDCALVSGLLPAGCTQIATSGVFQFITPNPLTSPGQTLINEYAALFGVWAKPMPNWRISFDTELTSADNTFTRISPRQSQEYRVRSKYKVNDWMNLDGSVRIWESRNNVSQIDDLQHNRSYGVTAILQPNPKFGAEIGYDYNDVFSQILICYISGVTIGGKNVPGPGIGPCPNVTGLVQQLSTYTNKSSYGFFDFTVTPVHRLTARVGANLTGTGGTELRLDPQALIPSAVSGPLNSLWLHPFGGFDYRFSKEWTGKAYWDYYGYHEDITPGAIQDIYAPRNFRANLVTLSLRYAF